MGKDYRHSRMLEVLLDTDGEFVVPRRSRRDKRTESRAERNKFRSQVRNLIG